MIRIVPALILSALCMAAGPGEKSQDKQLDEIYAKFSHVKSVRADFTEIKKQKAFKKDQVQKGTFFSSKDGTLVWKTLSPVKSTFTVKGTTAKVEYPDLDYEKTYDLKKQSSLGHVVRNIFAIIGASDASVMKKNYSCSVEGSWEEGWTVTLVPRSDAVKKVIARIILTITRADYITAIQIVEAGGDSTTVFFTNIVFNPKQE